MSVPAATLGPVSDQRLISRFFPVMTAGFPEPAGPDAAVQLHAELLHRICLADGLLEVLEWTQQGTGTDALACMWLAGLRWHRLVTGSFPAGAPQPPPRQTDTDLAALLEAGTLRTAASTGAASLAGLSSGELHYPSAPTQPGVKDEDVLLRLTPLALVPYIDEQMRSSWVEQNLAMTHGDTDLLEQGRRLVSAVHQEASAAEPAPPQAEAADPAAVHSAGAAAAGASGHPLFAVVRDLADRWEEVTAAV